MRNHRRYEVKKGRMMPRHQRSAATSSEKNSELPTLDSESDEDTDQENYEDENEGGESNESDQEEDD